MVWTLTECCPPVVEGGIVAEDTIPTWRKNYVCVLVLQASVREEKKLLVENARLKNDIADLRVQLQEKNKRERMRPFHFHAILLGQIQ